MDTEIRLEKEVGTMEEVWRIEPSYNLVKMAMSAGVYHAIWTPEKINIVYACELVPILQRGQKKLVENPGRYILFGDENGVETHEELVGLLSVYIGACIIYPHATIKTQEIKS